jgi:septal ring factor EnvC (AmiA/AmiB activator)
MANKNFELEYYKLENEKLKQQLKQFQKGLGKPQKEINSQKEMNSQIEREIKSLILLCTEMRKTLNLCRQQSLPMSLAKRVDQVLNQATELD